MTDPTETARERELRLALERARTITAQTAEDAASWKNLVGGMQVAAYVAAITLLSPFAEDGLTLSQAIGIAYLTAAHIVLSFAVGCLTSLRYGWICGLGLPPVVVAGLLSKNLLIATAAIVAYLAGFALVWLEKGRWVALLWLFSMGFMLFSLVGMLAEKGLLR